MHNSRLRVVFVCPPDGMSGGIRVAAIYAQKLAQRGHTVTVVIPRARAPTVRRRVRAALRERKWLSRPDSEVASYFCDASYDTIRLQHIGPIRDRDVPDADVVVATWWETAEWVWSLSNSKGVKVHFLQDYETWGAPNNDVDRVDAAIGLKIPKIVIAEWVQDLLVRYFNQMPLALVHNSVDPEQFRAVPRGKQAVATVGFMYKSMWTKGADITVAAIKRAGLTFPELRVVAFGTERPGNDFLPFRTEFHLRAPEEMLARLYSSCDAWLIGTRIEGFGLPILEAMACRTPVIATPAGAAPRLLRDGGGILVPMEDVGAMADAIIQIARMSDQDWRCLSNAAYQRTALYTWDNAADQFEAALISVAGQPNFQ